MNFKSSIKKIAPPYLWNVLRNIKRKFIRSMRNLVELAGFIVVRKSDYYAPVPSENNLSRSYARWNRPSALKGIEYNLEKMRRFASLIEAKYLSEFNALPSYKEMVNQGFGPGYPILDSFVLFGILRELNPDRYVEVGSGLSTAYASRALNKESQAFTKSITCIEPYPFPALKSIPGIKIIETEVQNCGVEIFTELQAGDVLFIDSSHMLKIDSDVAFLYLEVLPQLCSGVYIHIHDVPFPFNIPYPAEFWTLLSHPSSPHWPMFWNEAMLLQALLCGSQMFEIILSMPLLRYYDHEFIKKYPFYSPITKEPNTFSSIWIKRI